MRNRSRVNGNRSRQASPCPRVIVQKRPFVHSPSGKKSVNEGKWRCSIKYCFISSFSYRCYQFAYLVFGKCRRQRKANARSAFGHRRRTDGKGVKALALQLLGLPDSCPAFSYGQRNNMAGGRTFISGGEQSFFQLKERRCKCCLLSRNCARRSMIKYVHIRLTGGRAVVKISVRILLTR